MSSRDAFLQRVREAVQAGNRPGSAADVEPRGNIGYQGAADKVKRFCDELTAAGGQPYLVPDANAAAEKVLELVRGKSARSALLGQGEVLKRLDLAEKLGAAGVQVLAIDQLTDDNRRASFFGADVGISGVDYLVAETGTVVALSAAGAPRSLSLLPPVHIAVADQAQIVSDLFDLFAALGQSANVSGELPACVSLITGPSKTGDIELRLVTGVHGPGEIHVILIAN